MAVVVSVDMAVAVSVSFALDSLLLLHADARARIPHERTKNFAFIFFNLLVSDIILEFITVVFALLLFLFKLQL